MIQEFLQNDDGSLIAELLDNILCRRPFRLYLSSMARSITGTMASVVMGETRIASIP